MLSAHVMLIRCILSDPSPGFVTTTWAYNQKFSTILQPIFISNYINTTYLGFSLKAIVLTVTTEQAPCCNNGGDSSVGKNCKSAIM